MIYGIHAVEEALRGQEPLRSVTVCEGRTHDVRLRTILALAKERNLTVRARPRSFFDVLPLKANQGVIAVAPPFPYRSLDELLAAPSRAGFRTIVILDHLTDPHNVGAIVRTAEATGALGLVLPERRSAGVNATVRKAASGAAAVLPIARVGNVAATLRTLKKAGIWVFGAHRGPQSIEPRRADFVRDAAIVIGSEGSGLSPVAQAACDVLVGIPMLGRVRSLNASAAAAILLYEAVRQRDCSSRP